MEAVIYSVAWTLIATFVFLTIIKKVRASAEKENADMDKRVTALETK